MKKRKNNINVLLLILFIGMIKLASALSIPLFSTDNFLVKKSHTNLFLIPSFSLALNVNITQSNVTCRGDSTGSATVTATGGCGGYSYSWSTSPVKTTATVNGLPAGTYSVIVSDKGGCVIPVTSIVNIAEPILLNVSTTLTNILCSGGNTGAIKITIPGSTEVFSYLWSNPVIKNADSLINLYAGIYSVTVIDSSGCKIFQNSGITITEPTALTVTTTQTNVHCKGDNTGSATITVTGGSGNYSYSWNTSPVQTQATATGLAAGTYTVTVSDNVGCPNSKKAIVTITEPSFALDASITSQTNVMCKGGNTGSATVTAMGGSGNYTYLWNTKPVQTTAMASGLIVGTYTVTVIDNNGCLKSLTTSVTITEPKLVLSASITSQTNVFCKGDNTGSATITATGGSGNYTYLWNTKPVQTTATASGLTSGSYMITVKDNNGCVTPFIIEIFITEPAITLDAGITSYTDVYCKGGNTGSATITASGGTGVYLYSWNTISVQTTATAGSLTAGTYTVTVTDNNGCLVSVIKSVTISEPSIILNASIISQNVFCKGDSTGSATVMATGGSGNYFYSWNTMPIQTTATAMGLKIGSYTVTVNDSNGCVIPVIKSITITEPILKLNARITSQTNIFCMGDSAGSATIAATGGSGVYSYSWNSVPNQTTATATGLTAGSYTVTVSDNNGCASPVEEAITITEPSIVLAANVTSQTNVYCKGDSSGSVTVTVTGGSGNYSYLWNTTPVQTTATAIGLIAGSYTVTVSDNNGCNIPATAITIITEPSSTLVITTSPTDVFCNGDSTGSAIAIATGSSGSYSYSWNTIPVQTTVNANNLSAGSYTVTVTDNNGCIQPLLAFVDISEPQGLNDTITKTDIFCKGDSTGSATVIATGGSGIYFYLWNTVPVQTTATAIGLVSGNYSVTVTESSECAKSVISVVSITEPADTINANISTQTNVFCKGENTGSATIIATNGSGKYSYLWNTVPVQTTVTALGLNAGTYSVTVIDSVGCTKPLIVEVNITEPASALIATNTQTNIFCKGVSTGSATVIATGGSGSYSYLWNTTPIQTTTTAFNLSAGSYTATVTDNNGCTFPAFSIITINEQGILSSELSSTPLTCSFANATADLLVSGGMEPYSYLWSNGSTEQNLSGLSVGVYKVKVMDANNCVLNDSIQINQKLLVLNLTSIEYPNNYNLSSYQSNDGAIDLIVSGGLSPYIYYWSNSATTEDISNLQAGTYIVSVIDSTGCVVSGSITLKEPFSLEMPTGFSPNGDGRNDNFIVHGLELYPNNKITIYNRWGDIVYHISDYKNDWNGTNGGGMALADGTYFALLEISDKGFVLKGYVDLRRD